MVFETRRSVWWWVKRGLLGYLLLAFVAAIWTLVEASSPTLREFRQGFFPDKIVYAIDGAWTPAIHVDGNAVYAASRYRSAKSLGEATSILVFYRTAGDIVELPAIGQIVSDPQSVEASLRDGQATHMTVRASFGIRLSLIPIYFERRTVVFRPVSDFDSVHLSCVSEALVLFVENRPLEELARFREPCVAA